MDLFVAGTEQKAKLTLHEHNDFHIGIGPFIFNPEISQNISIGKCYGRMPNINFWERA